jgi:hypothetical protein
MSNKWWSGPNMRSGSSWRVAWFLLAILLLLGTLLTGVGLIHGAKAFAASLDPDPVHICDAPEYQSWTGWDCLEYIETYLNVLAPHDPIVGVFDVRRNGQHIHSKRGISQITTGPDGEMVRHYSEWGAVGTPEDYLRLVGCADSADGVEAMELMQDVYTSDDIMRVQYKGRA